MRCEPAQLRGTMRIRERICHAQVNRISRHFVMVIESRREIPARGSGFFAAQIVGLGT